MLISLTSTQLVVVIAAAAFLFLILNIFTVVCALLIWTRILKRSRRREEIGLLERLYLDKE